MQSNISQVTERPYDHVRDGPIIPEGWLLPPHKKTYWAALRGLGSRHYEISVCRPLCLKEKNEIQTHLCK